MASVTQTLLTALRSTEVRELSSLLDYKSRLEDLEITVRIIKDVLLGAESKHKDEFTNEGNACVSELKNALYDADDFFDKLITEILQQNMSQGNISNKVRRFFSNDNPLLFAFNKSQEIRRLQERLDGIASDLRKFGFSYGRKCVKREETYSYVNETDIAGRDEEKKYIVETLLSEFSSFVSFMTIVGMGGLGKTTLAQLVCNDARIRDAFGENVYWVCVSHEFDFKKILCKLLGMKNNSDERTLGYLRQQVLQILKGKKYLLILDDVWEEDLVRWKKLKEFLCYCGGAGSQVLVTTRSREVANVVNKDSVFVLEGLSEKNSWLLFKKITFGSTYDLDANLVDIGHEILKKCANVPHTIKVASSSVYGHDKSKWEEYLSSMDCPGEKNFITSDLMFSYYNLIPELKSCFRCCALFPKDSKIEKEELINLWLANGYLVPSLESEGKEDVGEMYFHNLLQRSVFQDVERDEYGEIHSCKMNYLMHDISQEVAREESLMLKAFSTDDLKEKLATVISNCRYLRIVQLGCDNMMNSLPDEMGYFFQLRHLDVSYNSSLKLLPKSITKLHNLRILNLRECEALTQLPKDIGKLASLRMLDIQGCFRLEELPEGIVQLVNLMVLNLCKKHDYQWRCNISYMPAGMEKLKNLHRLTYFVVGGDSLKKVRKGKLIDLKDLIFLEGHLCIKVGRFSPSNMPQSTKGADILRKARLKVLEIICGYENDYVVHPLDQGEYQETLLEGLNPNNDLRRLAMTGYQGINFPNWGIGKLTFPEGIVRMELTKCTGLKHLSSVSELVCLKYLHLYRMENLEYIESDATFDMPKIFFPSLEELLIRGAKKLTRWWRDIRMKEEVGDIECLVDANDTCMEVLPSFPRLRHLEIKWCENLKYFPPCPRLKTLHLARVNRALTFCMKRSTDFHPSLGMDNIPSTSSSSDLFCLEKLKIYDEVEVFNSLFRESFSGCVDIELCFTHSMKEIREIREGFGSCTSSVRHLSIKNLGICSVLGGIEVLTNLQSLRIEECRNLKFLDDKDAMPWKSLVFLFSLALIRLPKLVTLPKDFQYLSSLQSLRIERCNNFEGFGEFDGSLTSLQSLHILHCPQLKALPESIYHLTSLTQLEIIGSSSELVNRCQEIKGKSELKYGTFS